MGAPHDNLKRSVPKQLCDGTQIHSGHSKSTGKGMAVAMPAIGFDRIAKTHPVNPIVPASSRAFTSRRRAKCIRSS
jgi:hypothetical protein